MGGGKVNVELENVLRALREQGHRVTPQRRAILREALSTRGHISPGGVARAVAKRIPGVNASTVYRTLGLLEQLGFVSHSHFEEGYEYHLAGRADHVYLVCRVCGRDEDLDEAKVSPLVEMIEVRTGFIPDSPTSPCPGCAPDAVTSPEAKEVPLTGLVAAFVFAAQMLNFPVAAGTSGNLIGGVLAAVLVGPWAGALCIAVVLLVQALFADGGLTALGLNIVNMSFFGALGGYTLFVRLHRVMFRSAASVPLAAGIAAGFSVIFASIGFSLEYGIGGAGGAPVATVAWAMIGVHTVIGVGEGVITTAAVGTVLSVRPDLVYGAAGFVPAAVRQNPRTAQGPVGSAR